MKNRTGKALFKIVFAIFAVCMAISAIAFNLEKLQLSLIFFGIASVLAVIMIRLNGKTDDKNKATTKK